MPKKTGDDTVSRHTKTRRRREEKQEDGKVLEGVRLLLLLLLMWLDTHNDITAGGGASVDEPVFESSSLTISGAEFHFCAAVNEIVTSRVSVSRQFVQSIVLPDIEFDLYVFS